MSNFPKGLFPPPTIITNQSHATQPTYQIVGSNLNQSVAWAANKAVYMPIYIPYPITINQLFAIVGNSSAGNVDIGIYDKDGTRIVSTGSTAQASANTAQFINITQTSLGPGLYYIAFAGNNGGSTLVQSGNAQPVRYSSHAGIYHQTSAFPLPATATFATAASTFLYPACGMVLV